ncbi:MAG: hypothetical protein AAB467_02885, partial [Patescibacteria group bacterium]
MKKALIIICAILVCAAAIAVILMEIRPVDNVQQLPVIGGEKQNLIRLFEPQPNQSITSPVTLTGEARGNWFFEASL